MSSIRGKLKEVGLTHWNDPNTGATNVSGFSALSVGGRGDFGNFRIIGYDAVFWSSTVSGSYLAWHRHLQYNSSGINRARDGKRVGFSVRLVKDQSNGIETKSEAPNIFELYQNYPNPFNPMTTISYHIPLLSHVLLRVFDVQGREVTTLVNRVEQPGFKSAILNAEGWSSGVYYYQLKAGDFVQTRKLNMLR